MDERTSRHLMEDASMTGMFQMGTHDIMALICPCPLA